MAAVLLGLGLGCVLRLGGITRLHASVVARGDRAAAMIGPNRRGRSTTTAAALTGHGLVILSDDIVVLSKSDGRFWVVAGYPCLRITPRVAQLLHLAPEALAPVASFDDERYCELASRDEDRRWQFDVPVGNVSRTNDLEALLEVCALIAADFEQLALA